MSPTLIISASRRTDLAGFYPEWTVRKIRRIRRPIHSVYFWTKHPGAFVRPGPLRDLVQLELPNPFLLVTVTGLGATRIEPNVPPWKEAVGVLSKAVKVFHDQPERIRWRFDPLLPGVGAGQLFYKIAPLMGEMGIGDCIISLPAAMSLKGGLASQYATSRIGIWKEAEARAAVEEILETAGKLSIKIYSCATPRLERWFPGRIEPASCISAAQASRLHPQKIEVVHQKDPSQRKRCTCSVSEDIGSYLETLCRSGCLYCYSKAGGPLH